MTLDEAIKHAEEVAEENEKESKLLCDSEAGSIGCIKCGEEHRQLAEWLKDYKRLLEQDPCADAISRQAVIELVADYDLSMGQVVKGIHALPPITPQPKTGYWVYDGEGSGYKKWHCSNCKMLVRNPKKPWYSYCPNCGAKVKESKVQE